MSDDAAAKYRSLKSRFSRIESDARLKSVMDDIKNINDSINKLPESIKAIRSRGYAFAAYLEHKAEVLREHWDEIRTRVNRLTEEERDFLDRDYRELQRDVDRANSVESHPDKLERILPQIESGISRLEEKARSAASRVRELYQTLRTDLRRTESDLNNITWYCDMRDEAGFDFLANEQVFLVAKAEWVHNKNPNGLIFLTDQRMIFEQKETTGKTLGLFGGKKQQNMLWEVPLNKVEKTEAEKKGFFGGKDMLNFTLGSGAPYAKLTIEVKGGVDCKFWAAQVARMIKGETNDERAIEADPEMIEALRKAPTECHICGAMLAKLVANQTQINCEYCGAVIRIV